MLETPRLTLRPHVEADLDDVAATWADPAVYRYLHDKPFTREESWARVLRYAGHWALKGWGMFAVHDRATGRYAGDVGFGNFERGVPGFGEFPEAGWVLASWAHGRGYATEALAAATAWLDAKLDPPRTECMIDQANAPSRRVADKAGYREVRSADYHGTPVVLLERTR